MAHRPLRLNLAPLVESVKDALGVPLFDERLKSLVVEDALEDVFVIVHSFEDGGKEHALEHEAEVVEVVGFGDGDDLGQ